MNVGLGPLIDVILAFPIAAGIFLLILPLLERAERRAAGPVGSPRSAALVALVLALVAGVFSGCSTTLYQDGKPIARIQSDATGIAYTRSADGAVTFSAQSLSNSAPVLAAGKALTPAVMAVGSVAAMNAATKTVDAIRKPIP